MTNDVGDMQQRYNTVYEGNRNSRVAFPIGGIGAGMFCLEGAGALSHFSIRNTPNVVHAPIVFSAVCIKREGHNIARVLEGPVPKWKIFGNLSDFGTGTGAGNGLTGKHYGLPRFANSTFQSRFPFGLVELSDPKIPLEVEIKGWSPFNPLHANDSSLPMAGLEFSFKNMTDQPMELVYSFNAAHFMAADAGNHNILPVANGFILNQPPVDGKPWEQGAFSAVVDRPHAKVNHAWFRGGWFDSLSMIWKAIEEGQSPESQPITDGLPSPGASIFVPLELAPYEQQTVRLMLSWYVPETNQTVSVPAATVSSISAGGAEQHAPMYHKPWYAGKFDDIFSVTQHWVSHYDKLRAQSVNFSDSFYDTTLPAEVVEAVAANLCILKSPTVLRQTDGRLWGWEGCFDKGGCCHGSCTHVWNYAQSIPHLFPELERGLRNTEFIEGQDEKGHQNFRIPLPIQSADHTFHAASDGQLGGIMKVYREWRISGDTGWLKQIWPRVKQSLYYCMETWDPERKGILEEPHHNTYDIEFWGPDGMCSSVYIGALKAASLIAQTVGDNSEPYGSLYIKGRHYLENELFNGEYFEQKIMWEGLKIPSPLQNSESAWNVNYSTEAYELLKQQGPKYQYGKGCLSDGIIGAWMAEMCGLGCILDRDKVKSHLMSIYKYNLKHDLSEHANPQRPGFALGNEGGLLLCTWPKGDQLALPFVYSNEVWTGIEYQVASHLLSVGCVAEGLDIVRTCRDRFDGRIRNPFDEYECGHWYARAMASYGLIQGLSGIRYDACDRTLYVSPNIPGDFRSFLSTADGYGTAGVRDGKPFFERKAGTIEIERIQFVEKRDDAASSEQNA